MQNNETRFYRFGRTLIQLDGPDFKEAEYLSPFRAAEGIPDLHFHVRPADDIAPPDQAVCHRMFCETIYETARVVYDANSGGILFRDTDIGGGHHEVLFDRSCPGYYNSHTVLQLLDLPRRMIGFGGVFLHASFIASNGQAILFTAPKQTGKSTQASLWQKYRGAEIINGDRALIQKSGGSWYAYGSPYCGTSRIYRSGCFPIKAIVLLGQAKENRIRMASSREALAALLDGCSYDVWDKAQVNAVLTLGSELIEQVPIIKFDCLPDDSAVHTLEEFL